MEGVWATIFICHLIFGGHLLNIPHLLGDVYVSVDKDVLSPEYAATNWNQGSMTLEQLKRLLAVVLKNNRVIGMDICGELNAVAHDWQYVCGERLNGNTNEALLRFLSEM